MKRADRSSNKIKGSRQSQASYGMSEKKKRNTHKTSPSRGRTSELRTTSHTKQGSTEHAMDQVGSTRPTPPGNAKIPPRTNKQGCLLVRAKLGWGRKHNRVGRVLSICSSHVICAGRMYASKLYLNPVEEAGVHGEECAERVHRLGPVPERSPRTKKRRKKNRKHVLTWC